jgi:HSP20 family protein
MKMKLVKYTHQSPLDTLFDHFNWGLFPTLFHNGGTDVEAPEEEALRLPRTNIAEVDGGFELTVEMPGLSKQDVEVSVEGDTLTIKGGKTVEKEGKGWLRREIRSTKFERSFSLGDGVDAEKIKASMENGILTLSLPKSADKVGRKVDVS